jgi:hypothetical protein
MPGLRYVIEQTRSTLARRLQPPVAPSIPDLRRLDSISEQRVRGVHTAALI